MKKLPKASSQDSKQFPEGALPPWAPTTGEFKWVENTREEREAPVIDHTANYVFSIGLFVNFAQPEVVMFCPDVNRGAKIINDICRRAASGDLFLAGNKTVPLLQHYGACMVDVPLELYPEYFGYAMWFYHSLNERFPCVQFVWPDHTGAFPREASADKRFKAAQPVLKMLAGGRPDVL